MEVDNLADHLSALVNFFLVYKTSPEPVSSNNAQIREAEQFITELVNQEVVKARIQENEEWLEIVEPDHEEWFKDRIADLKATLKADTESNKEGVEVNE